MEDARRLLEEFEREYSAQVVHHVKTPLALMHGYAVTLLERDLPEERRLWFLRVIAEQAKELTAGLDLLESLRRLHAASDDATVSVGDLLDGVSEIAANLDLDWRIRPDREIVVRGEARWLLAALGELLAPSRRGAPERLAIEPDDRAVWLKVSGPASWRPSALSLYAARRIAERFGGELLEAEASVTLRLARPG